VAKVLDEFDFIDLSLTFLHRKKSKQKSFVTAFPEGISFGHGSAGCRLPSLRTVCL
jgi:hypothetical protein